MDQPKRQGAESKRHGARNQAPKARNMIARGKREARRPWKATFKIFQP